MPFWANHEIFLNQMVQKYQNEISPILYYGISTKTNEKDLKIPNLQPPNWKSPYWMTLYIHSTTEEPLLLWPSYWVRVTALGQIVNTATTLPTNIMANTHHPNKEYIPTSTAF